MYLFIATIPTHAKIILKNNLANDQRQELNNILSNEAKNINYLTEGEYSWDIIIDGEKQGSVTIKNEKNIDEILIQPLGNYNVSDGDWTTTYTFDLAVNGEIVLKSHYTITDPASKITPTGTDDYLTPPIGYSDDGHSSYYTKYSDTQFMSKGTYNIKLFNINLPPTYTIQSNFLLIPGGDASGDNLNVATFVN
ncbi:hypothetical protein QBE53_15980 [Vallitaleaceae bacterium 9-2]